MDNVLPKRVAHCGLCVLIVLAVSAGSIFVIAFIYPFSTEQFRNFAGFTAIPAVVIWAVTGAVASALKNPLRATPAVAAGIVAGFSGFVIWAVGGMLEFPFVYTFTQWHIRHATAWDGSPVSKILGSDLNDLYTDDYIG